MITIIELPGPGDWVKAPVVGGLFVRTRRRPIVVTGRGEFIDPDIDYKVVDEIAQELVGVSLWSIFDHNSFALCFDKGYAGVYASDIVEPLMCKGCVEVAEQARSLDELSLVRFRPTSFEYLDLIH